MLEARFGGAGAALTEAGRAARDARERRTDDLAMPPWRQLGPDGCARLLELLDQPVRLVVKGDGIPFPKPGRPPGALGLTECGAPGGCWRR